MSTRPPLVQVIENSAGQVSCASKLTPNAVGVKSEMCFIRYVGALHRGSVWAFQGFWLPLCFFSVCCLCFTAVIHQLAYALAGFPTPCRIGEQI